MSETPIRLHGTHWRYSDEPYLNAQKYISELSNEIEALRKQLEEAQEDSERLDWLENQEAKVVKGEAVWQSWGVTYDFDWDLPSDKDVRQAIDEKMKQES